MAHGTSGGAASRDYGPAVAEGGGSGAVAMYKRVHLREIAGRAEAAPQRVFDDWVNCCAFVGGARVAFAGDAASVNVWDRGQHDNSNS